jgi:hypothetical protein
MRIIIALLLAAAFWSCGSPRTIGRVPDTAPSVDIAAWAIGKMTARHGGELYFGSDITFEARERRYRAVFDSSGAYRYERRARIAGQEMVDVLDAAGFRREVDGGRISMSPSDREEAAYSLGQVLFFATFPHHLRYPAIATEFLGLDTLEGRSYYRVGVVFLQTTSGYAPEDRYVCWIHDGEYTLDYLAYSFERHGGGARFFKALTRQEAGGLLFSAYQAYLPPEDSRDLAAFGQFYRQNRLQTAARVEHNNLMVKRYTSAR